jgi:Flp pilus assembly protein TadG
MQLLLDLRGRLRNWAKGVSATAAIEFALVLPLSLLLYVGGAEVTDGVMASRKVATLTRTLVDLLSQQQTSFQTSSTPTPANAITQATLSSLLTSAETLLYPEPTSTLQMTVSAVDVSNQPSGSCCSATVRWSFTQNGGLRPCNVQLTADASNSNSPTSLPAAIMPTGSVLPQPIHYLIADVQYTYEPVLGSAVLSFAPVMRQTEYMLPRTTGQVVSGPLTTSGNQMGQVCY